MCEEVFAMRMLQPQEIPGAPPPHFTLRPHSKSTTPACLPTIPGYIQLH